ncbi:DUF6282 family protein [Rhizobium terrae]|uniref:DUF6282 family protein n=1 Tax=Rhizobium terrae TaxID=2171756 RepID=UPI000E3D82E6|nr:DUF6282 family protein [Rhizobium terrae]
MTEASSATADRKAEIADLLVGAVDLHCHSGPAVFPRLLDHYEAMKEASDAGFSALVYKDHFYPGMAHAKLLETLYPDTGVRLYSGVALNNASGGINPHAVDHAVKLGGKIVWMPTFAAANHIDKSANETKNYPKSVNPMLPPIPLTVLDDNGKLTKETNEVIDVVAAGDIILASGHLSVDELKVLYPEAKRRGVKKMMINHPTYVIGCSDDDIRELSRLGVYMEHSICMFIPNERGPSKWDAAELRRLVDLAGVEMTIFGSDLGLVKMPRPVEGYRAIVNDLLDLQMPKSDIRKLVGTNAAGLL